jgi:formate hydrogenlyase subunit 3/multisubunit Na+/H+ antiporter MnhD subunit
MTPRKTVMAAAMTAGATRYQRRPAPGSTGSASGEAPEITGVASAGATLSPGVIHIAATGVGAPGTAPVISGASPEADPVDPEAGRRWYLLAPAVIAAGITVFLGVIPQPLVEFATHAGSSLF